MYHHHPNNHQSVLLKDKSFTANAETKVAFLSTGRSSSANSGTKVAVLLDAVASRLFHHPSLSLASEQTLKDLRRSRVAQRGGEESGFD